MNILIIYCHPSQKSYTFSVFEQLKTAITNQLWSVTTSDLYSMNFQSDMTEEEYEREGFANLELPIPSDVLDEHKKLEQADGVIFLYPLWWSDCPAKLKGWFDRVYSVGYAYGYDDSGKKVIKMKEVPFGIAICTAGHPNEFLIETGIAQSMQNIMIDDRLGKRFKHKEMVLLGGTLELDNVRKKHQQQIDELIERIKNYLSSPFD